MTSRRPNSAVFDRVARRDRAGVRVTLPTPVKSARDSADSAIVSMAVLAWDGSRENSKAMAFSATPANAGNCVHCYPSQSSWLGNVPTVPAAPLFSSYFIGPDAQVIADQALICVHRLPAEKSMASSRNSRQRKRGNSRCEFSDLRRSPVSPLAALRPVATRRLNRVCWAQVPGLAQPLSPAATPKAQRSLGQGSTSPTAKPIRSAATDLTSVALGPLPMQPTTKVACGFGGFLLPKPVRASRAGHEPEGTFDVQ